MSQATQETETETISATAGPAPWSLDDLAMPEVKRQWSGEVYEEALKLDGSVSGMCPVQGEGELDGKPWYFRARYEHWTFTLAEAEGNPHGVRSLFHEAALESGWNIERAWPFGQYSAGYMPVKAALAIVRACARMYWAGQLPRKEADVEKYKEESRMLSEWFDAIAASSYCECSHNQPQHGIGRKTEVTSPEAANAPLPSEPRKCKICDCEDFRYSAEQSALYAPLKAGDQPDDATVAS
jgi:hypothetical protein